MNLAARSALLAAALSFGGALPCAAAEGALAPHRAVYDFTLGKSDGPKGPVSAKGRIVYEIRGDACTGYSVNFRQETEVSPPEGQSHSADVRSATFESADGKDFRYRIETRSNGMLAKLVEGSAERSPGGLSIRLTKPVPDRIDLGLDVVFPVQQTLLAIAAARKQERVLELKTFDGSGDGKTAYHTLQIIGAPLTKPAGDQTADIASMKNMKRWKVVASNFDLKNTDAPALYSLTFDMWENGISSNVTIDYGTFTLKGTMSKLEVFPVKPCKK
ncbi:MAG: cell envelope integrity EipB family protein [Hyphomicrobiales bacterium]|nr:cell envelope integrity EipB family protein [Hyphomicrobiales bacterium]